MNVTICMITMTCGHGKSININWVKTISLWNLNSLVVWSRPSRPNKIKRPEPCVSTDKLVCSQWRSTRRKANLLAVCGFANVRLWVCKTYVYSLRSSSWLLSSLRLNPFARPMNTLAFGLDLKRAEGLTQALESIQT